jgi:hypothetical protein
LSTSTSKRYLAPRRCPDLWPSPRDRRPSMVPLVLVLVVVMGWCCQNAGQNCSAVVIAR